MERERLLSAFQLQVGGRRAEWFGSA